MTTTAAAGAGIAGSTIAMAVQSLYGVAGKLDEFFESHIIALTQSANAAISRIGRVLEAAKSGFGLRYLTPVESSQQGSCCSAIPWLLSNFQPAPPRCRIQWQRRARPSGRIMIRPIVPFVVQKDSEL